MKKLILTSLAAAGALVGTQAATYQGNAVGAWTDWATENLTTVVVPSNLDGLGGNAVLRFGLPVGGESRFEFDGAGSDGGMFDTEADVPFVLGDFTYRNADNVAGSSRLSSAELTVSVTFTAPPDLAGETDEYIFDFALSITPNTSGDPDIDADFVTVTPSGSQQGSFMVGDTVYTIEVLGFSDDGGTTIRSNFSAAEGATESAPLYAIITAETVPTPDGGMTAMLLGVGVLGLAGIRRKLS